jgi:hypothetical protein
MLEIYRVTTQLVDSPVVVSSVVSYILFYYIVYDILFILYIINYEFTLHVS